MGTILELNQLTKKFRNLTAVNQISFKLEKGNIYGLLGPNGSGKSTTLGMLLKTILPTTGTWTWFDNPNEDYISKIGALLERPNFYPHMSAYNNLKIVCEIKSVPYTKINEMLALVGLLDRKNDYFKTFSLGMKQRLAIASAMLNSPEVLILDEPTNGLDPQGIIQIREIIQRISKTGTSILLASHLLDEVEKICTHVIVLKNGKNLYTGSVKDMNPNKVNYEIAADDLEKLKSLITESSDFEIESIKPNSLEIHSKNQLSASEINRYFSEKGIFLSLIKQNTINLENQFLELIKSN